MQNFVELQIPLLGKSTSVSTNLWIQGQIQELSNLLDQLIKTGEKESFQGVPPSGLNSYLFRDIAKDFQYKIPDHHIPALKLNAEKDLINKRLEKNKQELNMFSFGNLNENLLGVNKDLRDLNE